MTINAALGTHPGDPPQRGGFTLGHAAHVAGRVLVVAAGVGLIVLAGLAPVALLGRARGLGGGRAAPPAPRAGARPGLSGDAATPRRRARKTCVASPVRTRDARFSRSASILCVARPGVPRGSRSSRSTGGPGRARAPRGPARPRPARSVHHRPQSAGEICLACGRSSGHTSRRAPGCAIPRSTMAAVSVETRELLRRVPVFSSLREEDLARVAEVAVLRHFGCRRGRVPRGRREQHVLRGQVGPRARRPGARRRAHA